MNRGDFIRIAPDVQLGQRVTIHAFVNLYGCTVVTHDVAPNAVVAGVPARVLHRARPERSAD